MIGLLHGQVAEMNEKEILLMTSGGVGYRVMPAGSLLAKCQKGSEATIEVLTIVRETEISLYGFGDRQERTLFEKLIGISGIGPKTAIGMVSIPTGQFMTACEMGDVAFLTRIPGLGKKTAERLIIELRGKLDLSNVEKSLPTSKAFIEASDALENLGYDKNTINKILKDASVKATAEELVKLFLSSNA